MPSPRAWYAWRMCSILSLRKQVSTCSAKQSQQMLLRRLKRDFHRAINILAVQTVVSRQSQRYAQTHGKDSGPHWSSQRSLGGNYWGSGGLHEPGAQAEPGNTTEHGGSAEWATGTTEYKLFPWRAQSEIYYGLSGTPISLLSPTSGLSLNILKQQGGGRELH